MRWAQRQRLDYITERLAEAGRVNRADMIGKFDISFQTAAADFGAYGRTFPGAIKYDESVKAYVPGDAFNAQATA